MSNEYKINHYVPVWYQKRFIPSDQNDTKLFYLDLHPEKGSNAGIEFEKKNPVRRGPKSCFAEEDLYSVQFGATQSTEIEQFFFGKIDRDGHNAVDYYANFSYPWDGANHLEALMVYMSTQKLRTPKGLEWIENKLRTLRGLEWIKNTGHTSNKNAALQSMLELQGIYCAIWTECVWLIADASQSDTKFIVSDHPVTTYNRACEPRWCHSHRNGDPDIWLNGTHTIFPLSLDKILILTNLSWVRNPYQPEKSFRPNPWPFRNTIFKMTDIQTLRFLTEKEVRQINFIIKSLAHKYIAAAKEEWLYPEKYETESEWCKYGKGYLLMPDPRSVTYSDEIIVGHSDGTVSRLDEYGRRPGQEGFSGEKKGVRDDWNTFQRFQGEFARLFGPSRRGRSFDLETLDPERDSDESHQRRINLEKRANESPLKLIGLRSRSRRVLDAPTNLRQSHRGNTPKHYSNLREFAGEPGKPMKM